MSAISQDRWLEISPYLDEALSLPEHERASWLADFHQQKPDLAPLLEELLQEHAALQNDAFLSGNAPTPLTNSSAGQTLGAYRLISPIGDGGMGTVWLAERSDGRFDRKVAIKFIRISLASNSGAARFKREGKILAQLAHPNIAELIDAGLSESGLPYIVLEYIQGKPIDAWCDERRLDVNSRVSLFLDVLSAVSHAHANLVVHRDIKASNVLVRNDGGVKLLDFGIAKLLADDAESPSATQLTLEGGSALTPHYAAPEQITGGPITVATDVYALGALLYLLLAGKHPTSSDGLSPAELVKAITDTDPMRLSDASAATQSTDLAEKRSTSPEKLRRELHGDLDTILSKALKKVPSERYPTVDGFAADLRHFLKHEPISARPDSIAYHISKFVRRNRTAVALSVIAFLAATAGVAGIIIQARHAKEQRDFAIQQALRADAVSDLDNFLLMDVAPGGKPFTVNDLLRRAEQIVTREHTGDTEKVRLLLSIADHYWSEDEIEKARVVFQQAFNVSRSTSDLSVRALASCGLGAALTRGGDSTRGEQMVAAGLHDLPTKPEYALDRVYCLMRARQIADHNGDVQLAIDRTLAARNELNSSPLKSNVQTWRIEIDLADAYREAGRFREANAVFGEAYQLTTDLGRGDTQTAGTLLNNWALTVENLGQPLEAEKIFYRALQLSRDNNADQVVDPLLLLNYGRVLRELARADEAKDYGERALEGARKAGDQVTVNQALLELARIYRQAGQYARSTDMLDEVEPRLRKNLPPGHYAFASLASERELNAFASGDLDGATHFAQEAMDILQAAIRNGKQGGQFLPVLLGRQSRLELSLGEAGKAEADAATQFSMLQKTAEPGLFSSNLGYALMNLGMALEAQGKTQQARIALRQAAEHLERALGRDHPDTRNVLEIAEHASR